jgi:tRNA A-37 threonylcarbamoyl transferase component Bud32
MDLATDILVPPPPTIARYRVAREIGRGAMGVVYEAEHTELGRRVALKLLQPHLRANATAMARFAREGRVAARLRHPHVIEVLDAGTCEQGPFLVMEYVDGPTLAAHLRESKRLAPPQVVELVLPVLSALIHAHATGVVHRDVKPANVLLARDRFGELFPMIGDFGLGKLLDESVDRSLTKDGLVGSLPYLAPEQVREAKSVDGRADQYSLAVLVYEALAGCLPFAGGGTYALMEAICEGKAVPLTSVAPDVPVALAEVIHRAMRLRPEDRYPSLAALGGDLVRFASGRSWGLWTREFGSVTGDSLDGTLSDPVSPKAEAALAPAHRSARKWSWLRVLVPPACFALGGAATFSATRTRPPPLTPVASAQAVPAGPAQADEPMAPRNAPVAADSDFTFVAASAVASSTASTGPIGSTAQPMGVPHSPKATHPPSGPSTPASRRPYEVGGNNAPILE